MKLTHDTRDTKSAPGRYIVHLERPGVHALRFFPAGEPLAEQSHRTWLALFRKPITLEEITG